MPYLTPFPLFLSSFHFSPTELFIQGKKDSLTPDEGDPSETLWSFLHRVFLKWEDWELGATNFNWNLRNTGIVNVRWAWHSTLPGVVSSSLNTVSTILLPSHISVQTFDGPSIVHSAPCTRHIVITDGTSKERESSRRVRVGIKRDNDCKVSTSTDVRGFYWLLSSYTPCSVLEVTTSTRVPILDMSSRERLRWRRSKGLRNRSWRWSVVTNESHTGLEVETHRPGTNGTGTLLYRWS